MFQLLDLGKKKGKVKNPINIRVLAQTYNLIIR